MIRLSKSVVAMGSFAVCMASVLLIASCTQSVGMKLPEPNGAATISEGRTNAARMLVQGSTFSVDLLQYTGGFGQDRCYPFGDIAQGFVKWPSRLLAPVTITSDFNKSEYDLLAPSVSGETDYVLSVRVVHPTNDPHFTEVEFNFRAVSPFEANHVAGGSQPHYMVGEAHYTSNDSVPEDRSLIDLAGGDFAIAVIGLEFENLDTHCGPSTKAYMNGLGSTGWLAFMRDNAHLSGRFYAILGGMTGGPVALADTADPFDDGPYESVQVRGDEFDANSENPTLLQAPPPEIRLCPPPGPPYFPTEHYALLDLSNLNEVGAPAPGRGGFAFVMRNTAFAVNNKVVIDPSLNPGYPPAGGNKMDAPGSGYDEPALHAAGLINNPAAVNNPPTGPQGVHEIGVAVFFIHSWDECIERLAVEYVCSAETGQWPMGMDRWVIHNPNPFPVDITWEIVIPPQNGAMTVPPGDTTLETAFSPGIGLTITWDNGSGIMENASAPWGPFATCPPGP